MRTPLALLLAIATQSIIAQTTLKTNPNDFIPSGYVLFSSVEGDLNKDGVDDKVLLVKGTDKGAFVKYRTLLRQFKLSLP